MLLRPGLDIDRIFIGSKRTYLNNYKERLNNSISLSKRKNKIQIDPTFSFKYLFTVKKSQSSKKSQFLPNTLAYPSKQKKGAERAECFPIFFLPKNKIEQNPVSLHLHSSLLPFDKS